MAFFKLRFPGRQSANAGADALPNTPAESVEVIRKRARHRLMGSVVLVLGAVVGLPLLFDSQPRPVAIDTPIVIPDRNQAAPLATPGQNTKTTQLKERPALVTPVPEQPSVTPAKSAVANAAALDPHEEVVTKDTKAEAKSETKVETKVETKPDAKLEAKPESKEGAKIKALLDGKDAPKSSDAVRSVVQVGAFADVAKAKEARTKLEQAGLKTYIQEVETKEGKRIRVRVGPFATREEADKAAEKIRKLNLPTSILKL